MAFLHSWKSLEKLYGASRHPKEHISVDKPLSHWGDTYMHTKIPHTGWHSSTLDMRQNACSTLVQWPISSTKVALIMEKFRKYACNVLYE